MMNQIEENMLNHLDRLTDEIDIMDLHFRDPIVQDMQTRICMGGTKLITAEDIMYLIYAASRIGLLEDKLKEINDLPKFYVNSVMGGEAGMSRSTWVDENGEWVDSAEIKRIISANVDEIIPDCEMLKL
jgi:hypothetical protein